MNTDIFDVAVVGAGMVGLACALSLAREGFKVALIESSQILSQEKPLLQAFDSKVVAISRASENILKNLDAWHEIVKARKCAYQHMSVWDSVQDGMISFSAADFFEPDLGHIIEQSIIVEALRQTLKSYSHVTWMLGTKLQALEVSSDEAQITLDNGMKIRSYLVVGADGANSSVRQFCQIETKGWHYEQTAIVATVQGERSHADTAYQRFAPDGPLALLPLSCPKTSSIVWTTTPENARSLCQMPASSFDEILSRESQFVIGKMTLVGKRHFFPLQTQHAKQYGVLRCALVGDAAHTLHPLAGQGVNLGFLDVAALVEVITEAKKKKRDIGALDLLKRYERQRKLHNQIMIWAMELFKRGFGSQSNIIQRLRNIGLNWVDQHTSIKQLFAKMALGTWGPIPQLAKIKRES